MSVINLQNIRQAEGLMEELHDVRTRIEQRINLEKYSNNQKSVVCHLCYLMGVIRRNVRYYHLHTLL